MRSLRWKRRYQVGNAAIDHGNREFFDCLNSLIEAAGKREHCREMEEFIDRFGAEAEKALGDNPTRGDLRADFGRRLAESLPLGTYGSTACRQCGLCDLAREKVAEHLEAPAHCLFHVSDD